MEKRTAYVANYVDEGTWGASQDDPTDDWVELTYPILHPLVLVADLPTEEWLDVIKKDAVEEYLDAWDTDVDELPSLTWMTHDPAPNEVHGTWSQQHDARDAEYHLCIVLIVRRVEVAVA